MIEALLLALWNAANAPFVGHWWKRCETCGLMCQFTGIFHSREKATPGCAACASTWPLASRCFGHPR
jgi:MinD superfamily P-loop ATPase